MAEACVEEKPPKWIKTRVQHLHRHRDSGRYYVRGFTQGKEIWKALKTTSAEIARRRFKGVTGDQQAADQWAKEFLKSKRAAGHNWKTKAKRTISASRFNNTVDTLRHILDIGIKHGVILSNPAKAIRCVERDGILFVQKSLVRVRIKVSEEIESWQEDAQT